MEWIDWLLGLGAPLLFIIAAIMVYVGFGKKTGFTENIKMVGKVGAFAFAILGLTAAGLFADSQAGEVTATINEWDVEFSEAHSYVNAIDENHYEVLLNYNTTSNQFVSATQYCNISITVSRLDTDPDFAVTTMETVDVGEYTSSSTGTTLDAIAKVAGTNDYNIYWIDSNSGSHNYESTIPRLDTMRTDTATLRCVFSQPCADSMTQYHSVNSVFEVGGEKLTITWKLHTLAT